MNTSVKTHTFKIMDEPTSALTEKEIEALFALIRRFTSQGVAIVYISHRLNEIMEIGDRLTVFRDGQYINTVNIKDITVDEMVAMMVGREMTDYYPKVDVEPVETLLEVKDIKQGKTLKGVSFYSEGFRWIGIANVPGTAIPVQVVFMILLYILFYYIMKYRQFGRCIYSVGGNEEATRLSGINVTV